MNRQQRRALARAKKPGQSFAEAIHARQMVKEAVESKVMDEKINLETDILLQRFMWECIVALNEEFGFAQQRAVRYMTAIDKVQKEVEAMQDEHGSQYAYEKLRQRASQITGIEIKYIHEEEMVAAHQYAEADGVHFAPDEDL